MRNGFRLLLLWTCLLLVPAPAFATLPVPPPHRSGLLQPAEASPLVLRTVQLTVTVQENVSHAEVEGAYQVENPTGQAAAANLVWTYVDLYGDEPHPAILTVDGAVLQPKVQTDADSYRILLEAWLKSHPEVLQAYRVRDQEEGDSFRRAKLLADAGTGSASRSDDEAMDGFVHGEATRKEIRQLADRLLPAEAERLRESWRPWVDDWSSGIYWARFRVSVPAGGNITVRTVHSQFAPSWDYPVLLSQRTGWSHVGPVSAVVRAPKGYQVKANVPVSHQDDRHVLNLAALPDQLTINLMRGPALAAATVWKHLVSRPTPGPRRWLGLLLLVGAVTAGVTALARRRVRR